jgi:tetratricopeptide (TPR) repeat protein
MACLDDRLAQVRTLVDVYGDPDSKLVGRALEAARGLSALDDCTDVDALRRRVQPPQDPELRVEVTRVREVLDRVRALDEVGKYDEARKLAQDALKDAEALDYSAVHAEARFAAGRGELRVGEYAAAEKLFYEAIEAAEVAGHEVVKARAWIQVIWVVGDRQGRVGDANRLVGLAEAAIQRAGGDLELRVSLERHRGVLARGERRLDDAIRHQKRALAMLQDAGVLDERQRAALHNNLAAVYWENGDPTSAVAASRRAVELSSAYYGEGHPRVAVMQGNLGALMIAAGSLDEAEAALTEALNGMERAYGPEHPRMSDVLTNLGGLANRRGQREVALGHFERALAIDEKVLPPDHPNLPVDHSNLAIALRAAGDIARAKGHLERAVELHRAAEHPEPVSLARSLTQLASILGDLGEKAEGLKQAHAAAKLLEDTSKRPEYAESLFDLAEALVDLGGNVRRAVALAKKARELTAERSPSDTERLDDIDAWLKKHAR